MMLHVLFHLIGVAKISNARFIRSMKRGNDLTLPRIIYVSNPAVSKKGGARPGKWLGREGNSNYLAAFGQVRSGRKGCIESLLKRACLNDLKIFWPAFAFMNRPRADRSLESKFCSFP